MATSETSLAFSNEEINFFRLSCLLINEGTAIVRKVFEKQVSMTKKTLSALLKERENDMEGYRKLRKTSRKPNKPSLLTDEQWRLLYETDSKYAQTSKNFDLTLLSLLFSILLKNKGPDLTKDWRPMPNDNDHSWQAEIVRLRYKRNILYGHSACVTITEGEFDTEFDAVSSILISLGAQRGEIRKWEKYTAPSAQEIEDKRHQLQQLFEDDLADFQAFGERIVRVIEKALEKAQCTDTSLQSMTIQLKSLLCKADRSAEESKELSKTLMMSCKHIVLLIGTQYTAIRDIICHIRDESKVIDRIINAFVDRLEKAISDHHKAITQTLSQQTAMISHQTTMLTSLGQSMISAKSIQLVSSLAPYRGLFLNENKRSFTILMLTPPNASCGDEEWLELGRALGRCPWDVIIDLDTETKSVGHIFDVLSQTQNEHKHCIPKTYAELTPKYFSDDNKDLVAKGQTTLYLMALGCVDGDYLNKDTNQFREPVIKTVAALEELLKRAGGNKELIIMLLVSSSTVNMCIKKLIERLEYDCASVKNETHYVVINLGGATDSVPDLDFVERDNVDSKIHSLVFTTKQVMCFFLSTFNKSPEEHFRVAEDCSFTKREMTFMNQSLELYHADIGAEHFKELSDDERAEEEIKIKNNFLHGAPLTAEALCVNENRQVFVKRTEMNDILKKVQERLEEIKARTHKSTVFEIRHDPSGGGTTCGRFLLYTLRNEYPCLEIKKICENLYTSLDKIYNSCRKVCVILVDILDVDSGDVKELKNRLTHTGIRYLIIHVKMSPHCQDSSASALSCVSSSEDDARRQNTYYLKSEVHKSDQNKFRTLYEETTNTLNPTIFLFGLLAFCKDIEYTKTIEQHIDKVWDQSTSEQKRILRLCCVTSRYATAANSIRIDLFYRLFDLRLKDNEKIFGITRDFLLITPKDVRLAVTHRHIVDLFWRKLLPACKADAFHCIIQDIKIMVQKDKEDKKDSSALIFCLLEERDQTEDSYWSPFIKDLSIACGTGEVETLLKDILRLIDDDIYCQRIHCVYAKYLMYELSRPDDSLQEMQRALMLREDGNIYTVSTTDSEMLSVYGNLCRENVKHIIRKYTDPGMTKLSEMLEEASYATEEAIFVYRRAQEWKNTDSNKLHHPLPFWGEAFAYCSYARLVLEQKYKNDYVKFNRFINSSACGDSLLKGFATAAMQALDDFEFLKRNDRVYDNRPDITSNKIVQATFDILRLQVDEFNVTSDIEMKKKYLQNVPIHVPFNVGYVVRTSRHKIPQEPWRELDIPKLALIIEQIDNRMGKCHQVAANFESIITAMICIRKLGYDSLRKYNIDYAKECATRWLSQYPDDIEGHFMRGVLFTVSGLQTKDIQTVEKGRESMKKCYDLCEKRKAVHSYRRYRYAVGEGIGLSAVVPVEDADKIGEILNLRTFEGHQKNNRVKFGDGINNFIANVSATKLKELLISPDQETLLMFNVVFAKAGLQAVNVELKRV